MSRNEEIWNDRAERAGNSLTNHPIAWILGVIGIFIVLGIGGCAVGFIGDWGNEAKRVASPQNVREQNTAILDDQTAMQQLACQAATIKNSEKEDGDPLLVEDPAQAVKNLYLAKAQDYNRRMANLYEAQAVRELPLPSNLKSLPRVAPPIADMQAAC